MDTDCRYYIGIMSGTSMDGIDISIMDFNSSSMPAVIATGEYDWPEGLEARLHPLCHSGADEVEQIGEIANELAAAYACAVNDLLKKNGIDKSKIIAIGNHGQTIRHRPEKHFSVQIGNNALLAALTGIDTVGDFRAMDLACGGQGAPLVPAFHNSVFRKDSILRFIVNIGGISNISVLDGSGNPIIGFDTGPGNTLIDHNCRHFWNENYDHDGKHAQAGSVDSLLLKKMLSHPYFSMSYPKSTGRETFTYEWVESLTEGSNISGEDLQRTLTHLTAVSIADQINKIAGNRIFETYICGGGLKNKLLMSELRKLLPGSSVFDSTAVLGVDPDFVESIAFAWLAKQFTERKPGNIPSATGATTPAVLGCLYPKPY